jgi:hypothetical protein
MKSIGQRYSICRAGLRIAAALSMLLLLSQFTYTSKAQTICIPNVQGVPGNIILEPHWWEDLGHGVYYNSLSDPRWAGSALITYGDGTSNTTSFRILKDATNLYLSWRFNQQLNAAPDNNKLYLGLTPSGGVPIIVAISLQTTAPAVADVVAAGNVNVQANLLKADGTLGAPTATPAFLNDKARYWIQTVGPGAGTSNIWAAQVVIPLLSLTTGNTFNMWYEVLDGTPTAPVFPGAAWPRTALFSQPADYVFPLQPNWGTFSVANGCVGTGTVSIDPLSIGTTNTPRTEISYRKDPPGPHPVNTFYARPTNNSGMSIGTNQIQGTFRIANWGSITNYEDWEAGVNINNLYAPIQCFGTNGSDAPGVTPTECGTNVGNKGIISSGGTAGASNQITFDWALNNAQLQPWVDGTKEVDNCLLVELTSPLGLTFSPSSVRQNMDFLPASTISRKAQINIKGLAPIAADGRDVYIWVETLNMPKVSNDSNQPKQVGTTIPPTNPTGPNDPTGRGGFDISRGNQSVIAPPQPGTPIPIPDAAKLQELATSGQITEEQLKAAVPTYIAHVYYDTGQVLKIGGVNHPMLKPMSAFGFYVSHQGALYGWDHSITGDGVTLEQVAPNFYRIKKVPNNGIVTVVTTITANETAPIAPGLPWWLWLLLLLIIILLIILWLIFRKKK